MNVNISSVGQELYFAVNSVYNFTLFSMVVLIPLTLCVLCLLALTIATDLNLKVRALLINIFASEIVYWLSYVVLYVTFSLRAGILMDSDVLCRVVLSVMLLAKVARFPTAALYGIEIYVYIKHGADKMKWFVIISCIIVIWLVSIGFGILPLEL